MCGIVAVVRRRSRRPAPDLAALETALGAVVRDLGRCTGASSTAIELASLERLATQLVEVDDALRGVPGVLALLADPVGRARVEHRSAEIGALLPLLEEAVERLAVAGGSDSLEELNAAVVRIRDVAWAIDRDRLAHARAVEDLLGPASGTAAVEAYTSIQTALSALDRLEVRGRDSAGLAVVVTGHALDLTDPALAALFEQRSEDRLFRSLAVRRDGETLVFTYKHAAEVGELGDNVRALRRAIRDDELLRIALGADSAGAIVLGHTRWASVGIISEANAHPLDDFELESGGSPLVIGALNGDVDNYADLAVDSSLDLAHEITTDAKVIPALVARRCRTGVEPGEAFRAAVSSFEGSVAIAEACSAEPTTLRLAQRGSGQALYVGLAQDAFIVASEPYGVVEEAPRYIRLDGETPHVAGNPASAGEIVALVADAAGELGGVSRTSYDGSALPLSVDDVVTPEITTRDVDRGEHPHFLLKEITESPSSFRKTLRGRIVDGESGLVVRLGADTLPTDLCERLESGRIRRVFVVGQGTAAVAGQALASALRRRLGSNGVAVEALAATELSGFGITADMSDALVIAISQSGTTTDTNRTVDVVRARGGSVVSIVNRRQSDLVDKSHGVLYTSDGRDVEMSVASTKAFYSQIAAGLLLAEALGDVVCGRREDAAGDGILEALRALPAAMERVVGMRSRIAAAARQHATQRRSWAVVGNGTNRIAALEVRIKLSELCYKSIACDVTEDKKHIDLSAEPMVFVCAAGLTGSNASDVAKEIAIYRAHKAAPIVVATEGDTRYEAAYDLIPVPEVHPDLAFVLSAMVGHLFGYEAALAIDASALPLREARAGIEAALRETSGDSLLEGLARDLAAPAARFFEALRMNGYDGSLDAGTAVRVASLLRYATGALSLESYESEFGKPGSPAAVAEDLLAALTVAIEELTRPVDAIRHQAKTVTVGISRSDETLLRGLLVEQVLEAGVVRDHLGYRALRALGALDAAVDAVLGFTRYRVEGDPEAAATIHVVERGGVALGIRSRTDEDPRLRGAKHRVAYEREVTVLRGRSDGRTLVAVPEVKAGQCVGIALLHVRFRDRVDSDSARLVLAGYRGRLDALHDAVTETEPAFRYDILGEIPIADLLTEPVLVLAEHWRERDG